MDQVRMLTARESWASHMARSWASLLAAEIGVHMLYLTNNKWVIYKKTNPSPGFVVTIRVTMMGCGKSPEMKA